VQRVNSFNPLPVDCEQSTLTVVFHCTYPRSIVTSGATFQEPIQPRYAVIENVRGVLSKKLGALPVILAAIKRSGYQVRYRLYDAADSECLSAGGG
jgi:hypothetical protein